jgi:leucyl-tRNA synthetase
MSKYQPNSIEKKWQEKWKESRLYKVDLEKGAKSTGSAKGSSSAKATEGEKYYLLVELPYPSGDLHMGHWFTFAVTDILGRMKRMQGYNVFFPVGFDAFGLPAENAAIKRGINPREWTYSNIETMKLQFATMGGMHDFEHGVITCDADYYRWNQWIFTKMFEKGLAYRGKILSNWCPKDQTVLANENVEAGKCWRCGTEVVQKEVDQWMLKITDYADRLLWPDSEQSTVDSVQRPQANQTVDRKPSTANHLDWPKPVREGQNNWIGKSEGIELDFKLAGNKDALRVFTTALDTVFGVTFLVISPEHPLVKVLTTDGHKKEVESYLAESAKKTELERTSLDKTKTGAFTGTMVINPYNNGEVPVWVADYVLMSYGTGAVMGVPGHDARDHEFAEKFGLKILPVIKPKDGVAGANVQSDGFWDYTEIKTKFAGDSVLFNSGQFDGMTSAEAKKKMAVFAEKEGFGQRKVNYHLHDWSISRQRYWGTPIPIIHCDKCGIVAVPEKDLPVTLPDITNYAPEGEPPLATATDWVNVMCPQCGGPAKREVDTMDTFVDSAWYFLRYVDPKNDKKIFDKSLVAKWLPVEIYVGGAEHTLGHTLYSRFFVKFLHDIGEVPFEEYAYKRIHHGVILGPDGARMSKSKGNVVNPDEQVSQFGADAVRMYLAFMGPYDLVAPWNPNGLRGVYHFLQRVWELEPQNDAEQYAEKRGRGGVVSRKVQRGSATLSADDLFWMHKTIKKVGDDIAGIKYNTAVAALMEWLNWLGRKAHNSNPVILGTSGARTPESTPADSGQARMTKGGVTMEEYKTMLLLLAPFAPHMAEELWQRMNGESGLENGELKKEKRGKLSTFNSQLSIHVQLWPTYDPKYIVQESITIVVQVNGKVRDQLLVEASLGQEEIEKLALASVKVQNFLGKQSPRKVIFVPGKLINLVI